MAHENFIRHLKKKVVSRPNPPIFSLRGLKKGGATHLLRTSTPPGIPTPRLWTHLPVGLSAPFRPRAYYPFFYNTAGRPSYASTVLVHVPPEGDAPQVLSVVGAAPCPVLWVHAILAPRLRPAATCVQNQLTGNQPAQPSARRRSRGFLQRQSTPYTNEAAPGFLSASAKQPLEWRRPATSGSCST